MGTELNLSRRDDSSDSDSDDEPDEHERELRAKQGKTYLMSQLGQFEIIAQAACDCGNSPSFSDLTQIFHPLRLQ